MKMAESEAGQSSNSGTIPGLDLLFLKMLLINKLPE